MNPTPTAAPAHWPYREHRTLDQVDRDELRLQWREGRAQKRKSWRGDK